MLTCDMAPSTRSPEIASLSSNTSSNMSSNTSSNTSEQKPSQRSQAMLLARDQTYVRVRCCLLCIYLPALDRSLSLIAGTHSFRANLVRAGSRAWPWMESISLCSAAELSCPSLAFFHHFASILMRFHHIIIIFQ